MANPYNAQPVMLGATPKEGPKSVAWSVDFTSVQQYMFDLTSIQMGTGISMVQTLYVDNSQASVPFIMLVSTTNQRVEIPPYSCAYVPLVATNKLAVTMQSSSGLVIPIQALNIAMNAAVWSVNGTPQVVSGAMQVQDVLLESAVSGGKFNVAAQVLSGDGATYKPVIGATRAYGTSITTAGATNTLVAGTAGLGWEIQAIELGFSPDSIMAAAGENTVSLYENTTLIWSSARVYLPASAPTFAAGAAPLIVSRIEGIQLTSKVSGSSINGGLLTALTGGVARINIVYGLSPFVGG
jgi:hypothetical protein